MIIIRVVAGILLAGLVSIGISAAMHFSRDNGQLRNARWDSAGIAPDPQSERRAIIQVYGARAWGWRGIFAMHTWLVIKPENSDRFERFDVVGWGVARGAEAVRRNRHAADSFWAGNPPILLGELRGQEAARIIPNIKKAVETYPHNHEYTAWPGPNSNSFTAHLIRESGGLPIDLPPLAIGKDYISNGRFFAKAPSGTGVQFSLHGMFGLMLALDEGIEINLLGLTFGVDLTRPAIKMPGLGRLGLSQT